MPARLLVEAGDVGDVGVELGDQLAVAALARHAVDVLPAVALAQPQERPAAVDPRHFLDDVDPRLRLVAEHALDRAGLDVGGQEVVAVLLAVQLLDRHRVRIDPVDAREIGVARIALASSSTSSAPPSALTTPTRAAELVVPAFGYGILVITG